MLPLAPESRIRGRRRALAPARTSARGVRVRSSPSVEAVRFVVFVSAYVIIGRLPLGLGFGPGHLPALSILCPLAAAALTIAPRRWWPLYGAGIIGGSAAVWTADYHAPAAGVALGIGNLAQALLFALLVARGWGVTSAMDRRRGTLQFAGLGFVSSSVGATLTVAVLVASHSAHASGAALWLAETGAAALGVMSIAPWLLAGFDGLLCRGGQRLELAGWAGVLVVTLHLAFQRAELNPLVFSYLPLAVLLLAVMRLGTSGAIALPAILVPLSVWFTMHGRGPFAAANGSVLGHVRAVQLYGLTAIVGSWLIAALLTERTSAGIALEQAKQTLEERVAERTRALEVANAELARAAHYATLAAAVSHSLAEAGMDELSTLRDIAGHLTEAIGDACAICQLGDDGRIRILAFRASQADAQSVAEATLASSDIATGPGLAEAIAAGQTVRLSGGAEVLAGHVSPRIARSFRDLGVHSVAVTPMCANGQPLGAIVMFRRGTSNPFDDDEVRFIEDLADRTALALINARLYASVVASEQRFRVALEHSPIGATIVSLEPEDIGRFLWVNPSFSRLIGYSPEELLTMTFRDITYPDDTAMDETNLDSLLSGRIDHVSREKRYIRADGRTIWVRMNVSRLPADQARRYIAQIEDVTAEKQVEDELTFRASHDPLTGLANRRVLLDHLERAVDELRDEAKSVGLLYLDLDGFKGINDSFGHEAGDAVLRQLSTRLAGAVRPPDTVARLGGDEFAVLCTDLVEERDVTRIADRILDALSQPVTFDGTELLLTTSIGIATARSASTDPAALLRQADDALYRAKRRGRHRWEMFRELPQRHPTRAQAVRDELRDALEHGWFRLHYQPVVDLRDNQLVGTEALLRLEHPERGLIYPDTFIGVAEHSDLIVPIEEWVLHEVCGQVARWDQGPSFRTAINVSGRRVSDPALTTKVLRAAEQAGIDPRCLSLEMTERVLIEGGESVVRELDRLTDAGVGLAIDDFGIGYCSLTYLQRFPVDTIKIDRTFVDGVGLHHADTAIVESLVALARTLGLTAIAEGVETEDQLERLRALGCPQAQGYHFARPMPAEAISGRLLADTSDRWPGRRVEAPA